MLNMRGEQLGAQSAQRQSCLKQPLIPQYQERFNPNETFCIHATLWCATELRYWQMHKSDRAAKTEIRLPAKDFHWTQFVKVCLNHGGLQDMSKAGHMGSWELFRVVDAGAGVFAFHNSKHNRFVRMNKKTMDSRMLDRFWSSCVVSRCVKFQVARVGGQGSTSMLKQKNNTMWRGHEWQEGCNKFAWWLELGALQDCAGRKLDGGAWVGRRRLVECRSRADLFKYVQTES